MASRFRAEALPVLAALLGAGSANGQCNPSELGFLDTSFALGVTASGTVALARSIGYSAQ